MEQIILITHVLAAVGIISLILIQQGKGADMGASFGAGASQTLFGSGGGGNVLTKTTAILATVFFATSFGLAVVAKQKADFSGGVDVSLPTVVETPAAPVVSDDLPDVEDGATESAVTPANTDLPDVDSAPEGVDEGAEKSEIPE